MQYDGWFCEWGIPMSRDSYDTYAGMDNMQALHLGEDHSTADRVRPAFEDISAVLRQDLVDLEELFEPYGAKLPTMPCSRRDFFPGVGSLYAVETVFQLALRMLEPKPEAVGIGHVLFLPVEFSGRLWIEGEHRSWSHGSGALCEINRFRYRPLVLCPLVSTASLQTGLSRLAQYHEVVAEVGELQYLYESVIKAIRAAEFIVDLTASEPPPLCEDEEERVRLMETARRLRETAHRLQPDGLPFSLVTLARLLYICREALACGAGFRVDRP